MRTSDVTKRYLRVYDNADTALIDAGKGWYDYAQDAAKALTVRTFFTLAQAAGVIAVLSPRVSWAKNLSAARIIIDEYMAGNRDPRVSKGGVLTMNIAKAYRVLDGDLSAINGPKVTAFYRNIMGDETAVTVDSWMLLAALGQKWERGKMGEDVNRKWQPTAKERPAIEAAIRNGAARRGVSPAQFQAVVWSAYRGKSE